MRILRFAFLAAMCVASAVNAQENKTQYAKPELLIEPLELAKRMSDFVVLDVRPAEDYRRGHILGAGWIDELVWQKAFNNQETAEQWSSRIGLLGINNKKPVVLYDGNGGKSAARIWWMLRYWGVKDAKLLNGGYHGWITTEVPPPPNSVRTTVVKLPTDVTSSMARPARFVALPDEQLNATKQKVAAALPNQDSKVQIVDARSHSEHIGVTTMGNPRPGCIPGSKALDWEKLVDVRGTFRFKSAAEMKRLFDDAGIDLSKPAITHCQGGGRGALMMFAMELMGAENVSNYHASFFEWSKDEKMPVERKVKKNE